MASIYLSSTVADLRDHRRTVAELLRNCHYAVDAMEQYAARDERPRQASENDVARRDIYVGLFGWRYGYVPDAPANALSITELEYLAAVRAQKPRLVFLSETGAPLDPSLADKPGTPGRAAVEALRVRLAEERWVSFFGSPAELANKVITSVLHFEATSTLKRLAAVETLQKAADVGTSFLGNVRDQMQQLSDARAVAITVGHEPHPIWWNTRLHLVAALASDFTAVTQLVLYGVDGRLLTMAEPAEVRRALTKSDPRLEKIYLTASELARQRHMGGTDIERTISCYSEAAFQVFGKFEKDSVDILHPRRIAELGIRSQGEAMEVGDRALASVRPELLQKASRYVLITRHGQPDGIVDRLELSARIAEVTAR